jgi:hypothetical protein
MLQLHQLGLKRDTFLENDECGLSCEVFYRGNVYHTYEHAQNELVELQIQRKKHCQFFYPQRIQRDVGRGNQRILKIFKRVKTLTCLNRH